MKLLYFLTAALLVCWCCRESAFLQAQNPLPMPRPQEDEDGPPRFSPTEFSRLLEQMKAEREGLRSDWQSLTKRNARPRDRSEPDLSEHLKLILQHLQKRATNQQPPAPERPQSSPAEANNNVNAPQPAPPTAKPSAADAEKNAAQPPGANVVSQAHAHFKAREYEDALASFRLVDLKGQKASARAPVEYLMAMCLIHLGKGEEALPLFREVANSRGDDKLADYAQWHLEMLRWQRDIQDRLQQFRQRREGLEKRP